MRRLYITIFASFIMLLLMPLADSMAVSEISPLYTHYVYMFAHGGLLHLTVNVWALLVLHNLYTWYRVSASYLWAVAMSFFLLPSQPMLGASVITCFFIGFIMPYMWRKSRLTVLMTVSLLLLTCVLPGMAGVQHVASFVFGLGFCYAEGLVRDFIKYVS